MNALARIEELGSLELFVNAYRAQDGRPTGFNELIAAEIIVRLGNGETMRSICRDVRMPHFETVYGWMNTAPTFANAVADARRKQATAFVEEALEIVDDAETESMAHVQKADKRSNLRLKLAQCFDRETYGEKVQQDVNLRGVVITTADPNLRRLLED